MRNGSLPAAAASTAPSIGRRAGDTEPAGPFARREPRDFPPRRVITTADDAGALVITHGGRYGGGTRGEAAQLGNCYRNALDIAARRELNSVAFPAISTGVYGYPADEAAAVSSQAIEEALGANPSIGEVRLVFFQASDAETFLRHQRFTR